MEIPIRKFTMFKGLAVALATPFTASGEVDLINFKKLVKHVVGGGVDILVPPYNFSNLNDISA